MAYKLLKPFTALGVLLNFCAKASDMLWAGSVDIKSTLRRTCDNWMANEQLQLISQIALKIVEQKLTTY